MDATTMISIVVKPLLAVAMYFVFVWPIVRLAKKLPDGKLKRFLFWKTH